MQKRKKNPVHIGHRMTIAGVCRAPLL